MFPMKRPAELAFLLFLAPLAVGCAEKSASTEGGASPASASSSGRIGAVLPTFNHPFFLAMKDGMEAKARELGLEVDVRDGQDDDAKQIAQVETLLNLGLKAVILCPRDEDALTPAVEAANRVSVPILALNRRINGGEVVSYVGADDAEGGVLQGEELVRLLGPKGGKIVYLEGTEGSSPQRKRNAGLMAVLQKHPEIEVADSRFAGFQEDKAKSVMTDLVRRFQPGEIRAVVAQSDEMALPAAEVAQAEGWKDVMVLGFDGSQAAFDAVRDGRLACTILQDPREQGAKAVEVMAAKLKGETVDQEVVTPLRLINKANVDQHKPAY
ncbi:sugar ABC transporter substrate-binding protein [Planctomyces sp. SH-PL62]|uniref:sugar ABC transporter substrate-binding protein n=1 Tax=Planctomyces sp. SH-PL62 TaxID=1636152 RepID=UPI00078C5D90|nr:sugar ABC transporter substrate-binding protein [Planctomyces sp. SH-PL62]AMV37051.1 D-ribose-binding periplasmic protein precursor [Planctomyces sp. SH-PL62]